MAVPPARAVAVSRVQPDAFARDLFDGFLTPLEGTLTTLSWVVPACALAALLVRA